MGKLISAGILRVDKRKYLIDKGWVLKLRKLSDQILINYQDAAVKLNVRTDIKPGNYSTYVVHSMFELDNFWGDLALDYC